MKRILLTLLLTTTFSGLALANNTPTCEGVRKMNLTVDQESLVQVSDEAESTQKYIARWAEVEVEQSEGLRFKLRHDFSKNQTEVICFTPARSEQNSARNFRVLLPAVIDPLVKDKNQSVTLWQLQALGGQDSLGYWIQPQRLLSERVGSVTWSQAKVQNLTHRMSSAIWEQHTLGHHQMVRIIYDVK